MIAYFDTSSLVPLLVEEPGTACCEEHWMAADRVVSVRLVRVEAHAALVQAARQDRLSRAQLRRALASLEVLMAQLDLIDIDDALVDQASTLAEQRALRAYDAVHLAAALAVADEDLVLVAGDRALLAAGGAAGLATAAT